ncbi:HAD-IA family hydrolase [Candidatus Curtissbacteria bacterium]|nr:HAD-IA family hydrolase [Candidatus Curtissbacteria bacterium]
MASLDSIVLAAGEGKRMKPLGAIVPKVMLPILGKPVLYYAVKGVTEAGAKRIVIVVSKESKNAIQKYFGANFDGAKIEYIVQGKQLGPAQAISLALSKIKSRYFLVQYGDSLADQNIARNLVHKLSQNPRVDGVLAVKDVENPSRYGIVKYQNGQVVEIVEKPQSKAPSSHAVVGTFILKTKQYKKAVEKVRFKYGKEEFPAEYILRIGGKVITWKLAGRYSDFGKPEDLFNASQLLTKSSVKCIAFDADNTLYNSHAVAPSADKSAMRLLAKNGKKDGQNLYQEWQQIVGKIKDSKDYKIRTRLYSYGQLCAKYGASNKLAKKMLQEFMKVLLANLKIAKGIKEILALLPQDKYIVTDDIKELTGKKLNQLNLSGFFKGVITSDKVGTTKPSKKFYQSLLAKFDPQEILVVGDNWQKDLEIPAKLGMQVLFVENRKSFEKLPNLGIRPPTVAKSLKIHIMGIAGAGAAAVAGIAKEYGYQVTGCDLAPRSPYTQNLQVKIEKGHDPSHTRNIDLLVMSPAVEKLDPDNAEIERAKEEKIPVMSWQHFQGKYLQKDQFTITVAGAYGKSTTTAMIAKIATDLNLDPTCEIGAKVLDWDANFRVGKSKYYVCESDEYNNNFLNYYPDIAVVLNVAWDHPDFFKTQEELFSSYQKFVANIKKNGILIIFQDRKLQELANGVREDIKVLKVEAFGKTNLKIIGEFRQQNAQAALTVAQVLGLDVGKAKSSLASFSGIGRRLEYKGRLKGVKFYDDYAVQPYTVLKTANALKAKYNDKKVLLVLEPHTFSRVATFFNDFIASLKKSTVDQIFVTDVYAAREKGDKSALSKKLAKGVGPKAKYTGSIRKTAIYTESNLGKYDIVCSMGAGNSYKFYDLVKQQKQG